MAVPFFDSALLFGDRATGSDLPPLACDTTRTDLRARTARAIPSRYGALLAHLDEPGSPETGAILVGLGVGNAPEVAQCLGCTPDRSIEHAVRVAGAVCAGAVHLQRQTVIQQPGDRSTGSRHTDQGFPLIDAGAKLPATRRPIVAMVQCNKCAGGSESDWADLEAHREKSYWRSLGHGSRAGSSQPHGALITQRSTTRRPRR